jgi:Mn2+/Fe2+ NRAMP family transporter
VNAAILIVAAATFHTNGYNEIATLEEASKLIDPILGTAFASKLFGIALLASGQSSTVTGTLTGQVKLTPDLSQLNPDLSQLNPNLTQTCHNLTQTLTRICQNLTRTLTTDRHGGVHELANFSVSQANYNENVGHHPSDRSSRDGW